MRVWDNQTNKARTVSEAEAQQGIAEGRFQIRSGIEIPVRNPEGEAYTISSDEAAKAFQKGWTLETPEQSKQVFDQAEEKARKAVAEDMDKAVRFVGLVFGPHVKGENDVEQRKGMSFVKKDPHAVFELIIKKPGLFRFCSGIRDGSENGAKKHNNRRHALSGFHRPSPI